MLCAKRNLPRRRETVRDALPLEKLHETGIFEKEKHEKCRGYIKSGKIVSIKSGKAQRVLEEKRTVGKEE